MSTPNVINENLYILFHKYTKQRLIILHLLVDCILIASFFFLFNLPFVFIALIVFRFTPPSPLLTMPFHWRWYYYHYIITAFQWILFLSCFCSNSPWRNPKMLVGWNAGVVFKTWNTSVIDFTIVILLAGSAMCKLSNAFRMFRLLVIVISCSASF